MADYENAVEIENLTKKYDGFTLDNVSFKVPKGSIMGFIGQNGAGKSTTIRAMLNITKKDSGSIKLLGMDSINDEYAIKEQIAVVFDELPFQDSLNAVQISRIFREIYKEWSDDVYFGYIERFQLPRKKKVGQFSKGMKMKLQIACALSHNAQLLVMDEATTGLDPVVRNEILDIFLEYLQNEEHSILMSSHITSDLEKIADSVTFIDRGKVLLTGYKDDILYSHAIVKCSRDEYNALDREYVVSARVSDYSTEVMVKDADAVRRKYPKLVYDNAALDEIMLYYVNREKKEWS